GPLHGGANEAVINTLERIVEDGGNVQKWVDKAKDPNDSFRLSGFGHRVYKNFDPRATIIKRAAERVLAATGADDALFEVAQRLEDVALHDEYFVSRKLYPNVDFYSGLIYRAVGFPKNMFTNSFAIGRLPGWIAQWREMMASPESRLGRPRQVYVGSAERAYVPIERR
ncbi:MAG TPA: citrate/2-methylcitrate synthase, partial [Candidatus Limnocylindria bacterium]